MNDPIDQPLLPLSEREDIQEVGEEQLEDISGGGIPEGVLNTPGRGVLQRSDSAPGRLQGNRYLGEVFTPPTASPTNSSIGSSDLSWRSHGSYKEDDHGTTEPLYPFSPSA